MKLRFWLCVLRLIFLAAWSVAWSNGYFFVSEILVAGNLTAQLYTVFFLLHVERDEHITPINYLTHLVMKSNAGLAVLFLWKSWAIIDVCVWHFFAKTDMTYTASLASNCPLGWGDDKQHGVFSSDGQTFSASWSARLLICSI